LTVNLKGLIEDESEPARKLLEAVSNLTKKTVQAIISHFFRQFPSLNEAIQNEA
jgi:hypothetical protein